MTSQHESLLSPIMIERPGPRKLEAFNVTKDTCSPEPSASRAQALWCVGSGDKRRRFNFAWTAFGGDLTASKVGAVWHVQGCRFLCIHPIHIVVCRPRGWKLRFHVPFHFLLVWYSALTNAV